MIPLNDLTKQPKEVVKVVKEVLKSGRFVKGKKAEEFEEAWAKRCEMKHGIAVSSGATALELVVQVLVNNSISGTVSYDPKTFKAVPNAIYRMGNIPRPVMSHPMIYAHHLHDEPPQYTPLIEDCSHCHGYVPTADTAIFSLYPGKILGACGDAGIIVTDDDDVAEGCRSLRNHGIPDGTNGRMDEIQAAILLAKLPYLDEWIAARQEIVKQYDEALGQQTPGRFHYAYTIPGSEEKRQKLLSLGVESKFYYTPTYMALPLYPQMSQQDVQRVIYAVKQL